MILGSYASTRTEGCSDLVQVGIGGIGKVIILKLIYNMKVKMMTIDTRFRLVLDDVWNAQTEHIWEEDMKTKYVCLSTNEIL